MKNSQEARFHHFQYARFNTTQISDGRAFQWWIMSNESSSSAGELILVKRHVLVKDILQPPFDDVDYSDNDSEERNTSTRDHRRVAEPMHVVVDSLRFSPSLICQCFCLVESAILSFVSALELASVVFKRVSFSKKGLFWEVYSSSAHLVPASLTGTIGFRRLAGVTSALPPKLLLEYNSVVVRGCRIRSAFLSNCFICKGVYSITLHPCQCHR
ncbi:hypothetical protein FPV67DRAFT_6175 [Lyophyllum atratum]|nr:hypothetical protein FPV67DRAFT_6175 [Lyophyllum atratum]